MRARTSCRQGSDCTRHKKQSSAAIKYSRDMTRGKFACDCVRMNECVDMCMQYESVCMCVCVSTWSTLLDALASLSRLMSPATLFGASTCLGVFVLAWHEKNEMFKHKMSKHEMFKHEMLKHEMISGQVWIAVTGELLITEDCVAYKCAWCVSTRSMMACV